MSDNAKAQVVSSLQFNEAHMNRLRNELAIADTNSKIAYVNALKVELEKSDTSNSKSTASKSKKKENF